MVRLISCPRSQVWMLFTSLFVVVSCNDHLHLQRELTANTDILSTLYNATSGSGWSNKLNWNNGNPCPSGAWYGVTCASSDVVALSLATNNLQGSFPSELSLLTTSTYFQLSVNSLTGPIPSELGILPSVVYLKAFSNLLSSSIPSQLGLLTSLTDFAFSTNNFHGTIPSQLGQLTKIQQYFNLEHNFFSGSIPSELGKLTDSSYFSMKSNVLCDTTPAEVYALSSIVTTYGVTTGNHIGTSCTPHTVLAKLYTSTGGKSSWTNKLNWMSRTWPCPSGGWYAVTCTGADVGRFTLGSNSLIGTIPTEAGLLSKLTRFVVNTNQLTGTIPTQLGQLTLVFDMFLTSNKLTGTVPSQLGMLDIGNGYFSVSTNSLTGSIPSELGLLSKATTFRLNTNTLCGDIPVQVSALSAEVDSFIISGNSLGTACCLVTPSYCTSSPIITPTPSPTSAPSTPTVVPTPMPTVNCSSGTYFDGSSCVDCEAGRYSKFNSPPYPTSCTLCSSGQYQSLSGKTSCTDCNEGELSSPDRDRCTDCSAGEYAFNDTSCERCPIGQYAPQALSDGCVVCSAGAHTNLETGATTCSACDAGKYSNGSAYLCTNCARGYFSSFGATVCTACLEGYVAPTNGSSSCTACSAGTFAPSTLNCTVCAKGRYQGSTAQTSCTQCDEGKYAPVEELTTCIACAAGTIAVDAASSTCTDCPLGTYQGSTGQAECVNCDEGKFASSEQSTSCSNCDAGKYANTTASICANCPKGKYSSSAASSCTSCPTGFFTSRTGSPTCTACSAGKSASNASSDNCTVCPIGTYQGSTGQSSCVDCDEGKYASSELSTSCSNCDAGKYAFYTSASICENCPKGKFSSSAASSCTSCPTGFFTSRTGSPTCTACSAGKSASNASSDNCTVCPIGTYQGSTGQSSCVDCEKGFFSASLKSTTCTACSAGTYSSNASSSSCDSCAAGTYQGSTGQSSCVGCEGGKYASSSGSTSCANCPTGYSSFTKSADCSGLAESDYYIDYNGVSRDCPAQATCSGGYEAPIPEKGYWVDHSSYEYAGVIYRCVRFTCLGGSSSSSTDRRLSTNTEDCWNRHQFNKTKCQDDTFQCSEGSGGVLCGSCIDDYIYSAVDNACGPCGAVMNVAVIIIGGCLVSALLVGLWMHNKVQTSADANNRLKHLRSSVNTGSLKIIWVTYQIMVSVSFNLDVTFPSPFKHMQSWFSVFALDIISLECLNYGTNRYFFSVYIWAVFPLIIAVLIVIFGCLRCICSKNLSRIYNQHVYLFLFWSYIVLPPASNKQLQVFDCISLDSGERYLRVDTSVSCSSIEYKEFRFVIIASIVLYQSIPILWWSTLYDRRRALNPLTNGDAKSALYMRDNNPSLASLRFLFFDYKCGAWWFEIVDMYRRIIFIGILPLVSTKDVVRSSFGVILAIISLVLIREEQPYRDDFNNSLAYTAQISILVTFYSALSIETNSFMFKGTALGVFLFAFNSLILVLAGHFASRKYRFLRSIEAKKEKKAERTEWAFEFAEEKFKTTFASLWLHDIPPSHTIVFYYTTQALALQARKSGIPAKQQFNGVALSLRSPYETQINDFKVFKEGFSEKKFKFPNEEVLVLSLPMIFLDPLLGYEDDSGLCMISQDILSALRPSNFTAVVDPFFWQDLNLLMLPPQCILRSFLIKKPPKKTDKSNGLRMTEMFSVNNDNEIAMFQDTIEDVVIDRHRTHLKPLKDVLMFNEKMKQIRKLCSELNYVPLYHYTSVSSAKLILQSGLRMSTQGQGDGGVYVSTQGPASYGFGSDDYEDNIIIDCFGSSRLGEYQGKGYLDVVLVYGCRPSVLEQTPGGRPNAKMVSKSTFSSFSLAHSDQNYFLRPDRIFGAFDTTVKKKKKKKNIHNNEGDGDAEQQKTTIAIDKNLIQEIDNDEKSVKVLMEAELKNKRNYERIYPLKLKSSELTAEEKKAVRELEQESHHNSEKKSRTPNLHMPNLTTSTRGGVGGGHHHIQFPVSTSRRISKQNHQANNQQSPSTQYQHQDDLSFSPTLTPTSQSGSSIELHKFPSDVSPPQGISLDDDLTDQ